jgi:3-isopropylmalate/(R)-2-methylmalate dehydratase small subunit
VRSGDIVVAGRNFGCGSSRETAAENLKVLGVACVVAESFSRLFMRNAVAVGLPVLVCAGVHAAFDDGDRIEIDLASGVARNTGSGTELQGDSLPEEMRQILAAGGILGVLESRGGA